MSDDAITAGYAGIAISTIVNPERQVSSMNWPNPETIEAKLSGQGLPLSNLRFLSDAADRSHHAKLTGIDSRGNEYPLFIKRRPRGESVGTKELFTHRKIVPTIDAQVTPLLRASWEDEESLYLVTDDVSPTHFCPGSPKPRINEAEFVSVIELYARFHTAYWGLADKWSDFFIANACPTVSHEATDAATIANCQHYFLETCLPQKKASWGDGFLPEWDERLPDIVSLWAKSFTRRCENRKSLTLIQGDAHLGNVMVPRSVNQATTLLIDWEGICTGIGAWDIARLIYHTNWDESSLIKFEDLALKNYHRVLTEHNVSDYSYSDLMDDYRLSVLAYVPHTLAWGNSAVMKTALGALERWEALN